MDSFGSSPRSHPGSLGEVRQNSVPTEFQEFFRRESGYDMHPVYNFHMAFIPGFGSTNPYLVSPTHAFGEYGVEHDLSSATGRSEERRVGKECRSRWRTHY